MLVVLATPWSSTAEAGLRVSCNRAYYRSLDYMLQIGIPFFPFTNITVSPMAFSSLHPESSSTESTLIEDGERILAITSRLE